MAESRILTPESQRELALGEGRVIEQRRARDRFGRTRDEHHRDEGVGHGESKADLHLDAVTAAEAIVRPVQRGNILGRIRRPVHSRRAVAWRRPRHDRFAVVRADAVAAEIGRRPREQQDREEAGHEAKSVGTEDHKVRR